MYLAVAIVGNRCELLDATKGLLLYIVGIHAECNELFRDIVGTLLTESLIDCCSTSRTVSSTNDTYSHVSFLSEFHNLREIFKLAVVGEVVCVDLDGKIGVCCYIT